MTIVRNLGYIIIEAKDPQAWADFAVSPMGAMSHTGEDNTVYIRLDHYKYRLLVVPSERDGLFASGWATANHAEYLRARDHVTETWGVVRDGTADECRLRAVEGFFSFQDPAGNRHEVAWGRTRDAKPFISPSGIDHFVTGDMGFGHVVLPCGKAYDECMEFYQKVLRFEYSDFFRVPPAFDTGVKEGARVHFFHPENVRQHSLAIGEMTNDAGIAHFEVEVPSLDDVGRAIDQASQRGLVARTLGRHVNDSVVSFYIRTPGGFLLEYGYDGEQVDWDTHEVMNIPQGSHWGHQWIR